MRTVSELGFSALRVARLLGELAFLVSLPTLAAAGVLYSNGPVNGNMDAWPINFGYAVSDSYLLSSASTVAGFDFYVWMASPEKLLTVDWSISSSAFGGTVYGSGTANVTETFVSINDFGLKIAEETVSGLSLPLEPGAYWLTLQNATTDGGGPVYWDENSGVGCPSKGCPSQAVQTALGTIPSEAFDIFSTSAPGPEVPEPGSFLMLVSGMAGITAALRRKFIG